MAMLLLLLVLLLFLICAVDSLCSHLHVPPASLSHALVHVDSFEPVEGLARAACEAHGVPNYKCESVRRELSDTLQEMAELAIREAVVNVTLDHTLTYDISIAQGDGEEKASERLNVIPEEPLTETLTKYCAKYDIDPDGCERARVEVMQLVARDWGCDDFEVVELEEEEFIEVPILLDGSDYSLKLDTAKEWAAGVAEMCASKRVAMEECAAVFRLVQDLANQRQVNKEQRSRGDLSEGVGQAARVKMPRLRLDSPIPTRLYPQGENIYIKPNWDLASGEVFKEDVCFYFDGAYKPASCLAVPLEDTLYLSSNSMTEGYHLMYTTDRSGSEILAATMFQVVVPQVELLELYTSSANSSTDEFLMATIRTTRFDPFDSDYRVCIRLDHSFECLDPEWMVVDEQEFQHGTKTEAFRQSVTFRSPLDHAPLEPNQPHELSVLLVSKNNKALSLSETFRFDATPNVNRETSQLHVLDPRLHTPQKPRVCPELLRITPNLQWICGLWRHEWGLYSQNGEDGILREIFRRVGTAHKAYVEFGTESGAECNTRYLREIDGWTGLLMDGGYEDKSIELHREFITRDNFMMLLTEKYARLVPRDLDLLSIDVNFNDYWLLDALDLTRVTPRVLIVEVNSHIAADEARTVDYDARDDGSGGWDGFSAYFGASVAAFYRWGARHGYSLVYCESHGVNCFFVRNDVLGENVSAVLGPAELQNPPNFFGQGWKYPNDWKPHHKWTWV